MAAATQIEIQSFVDKFSHLSSQGYLSTLNFTCHQGKVSVNFQADLGYMHGTPEPLTHFLTQQRYMKPSQVRRRNRRCETQPVQRNIVENEVSNVEEASGNSIDADEENIGDSEEVADRATVLHEDHTIEVPVLLKDSDSEQQLRVKLNSSGCLEPRSLCCVHICRRDVPPHDRNNCCLHRCRPGWSPEQRAKHYNEDLTELMSVAARHCRP